MSCFDGSVHQSWHCSSDPSPLALFSAVGTHASAVAGGGLGDARLSHTSQALQSTSRRRSPVRTHRCSPGRCTSLGTARRRTRRPLLASGRTLNGRRRRARRREVGAHVARFAKHQSQKWPGCSTRMGLPPRRCTSLGTARRGPVVLSFLRRDAPRGRRRRLGERGWCTRRTLCKHQSQKWPGWSTRQGLPSSVHQSGRRRGARLSFVSRRDAHAVAAAGARLVHTSHALHKHQSQK